MGARGQSAHQAGAACGPRVSRTPAFSIPPPPARGCRAVQRWLQELVCRPPPHDGHTASASLGSFAPVIRSIDFHLSLSHSRQKVAPQALMWQLKPAGDQRELPDNPITWPGSTGCAHSALQHWQAALQPGSGAATPCSTQACSCSPHPPQPRAAGRQTSSACSACTQLAAGTSALPAHTRSM